MNFDFSETQLELRDTVRRLLAEKCKSSDIRAAMASESGIDSTLWQVLSELGLIGANIPEKYGGSGYGHLELCVIAAEIGRVLAPVPFGTTVYEFVQSLLLSGNEEQKNRILPQIASGQATGTVWRPSRNAHPQLKLKNGRLSGNLALVVGGMTARWLVTTAVDAAGNKVTCLADLQQDTIRRATVKTFDPLSPAACIEFSGAAVEPLVQGLCDHVRDIAAVLYSFELVGGAERCLEMARDQSLERIAFGRPIGSFQAIKHMLANMFITATLARSNAYYGAWALSNGADELPIAAATTRLSATAAYQECSMNNIQIHGGAGFTWDLDCHFHYRRSNALALHLGSTSEWEAALVDRMAA